MTLQIQHIIRHLFQAESLEEVPRERLEELVEQHPSFGIGRYLLSKKLQAESADRFSAETSKTNLYFTNPYWLQWLLDNTEERPGTQHMERTPAPLRLHDDMPSEKIDTVDAAAAIDRADAIDRTDTVDATAAIDTADAINRTDTVDAAAAIDTANAINRTDMVDAAAAIDTADMMEAAEDPLLGIEPLTEPMAESINESAFKEEETDGEPVIAMVAESDPKHETEFKPEPEPEPGFELEPEPEPGFELEPEPESEFKSASNIQTETGGWQQPGFNLAPEPEHELEPGSKEGPEPEPDLQPEPDFKSEPASGFTSEAGSNPDFKSESECKPAPESEFIPESEPEALSFAKPVAEPELASEPEQASQPEPEPISPEPEPVAVAEPALAIDPYHTIDYFASQGIRFVLEENPSDKLGKQLKSFTEWLRVMKRLPQKQEEAIPDPATEHRILAFAAHSNETREIVTETMAEVLAMQGMSGKAADVYRKLSLLNPGKSAYFAGKIEQLKVK